MTGSLQTKNDKYYIVLNTYENGKRKPIWISTGLPVINNKRKAEQMLRDKLMEYEAMSLYPRSDVLFSDYVRTWIAQIKRSVDAVTLQGYEVLANSQILPYFDEKRILLQKLTFDDIQRYIDEKQLNGRKDGKGGLSARSLRLHKNIINQTLQLAVKNRLIPHNPCEFVVLPKVERYEASFFTSSQLRQLFDEIKGDALYPLLKITALYGLRKSEVLGLKWDSVDFENGILTVRHTVSKVTEIVEKDKTKNASSYRSFPLLPEAITIFRDAKIYEAENRKLFGKEYIENEYVFKWDDGHPYSPDYLSRQLTKMLERCGLPHIRFHDLRHSCASLMLNAGCALKDVQEWLGHSDIKMTANVYGHLDINRKKQIAATLSDLC